MKKTNRNLWPQLCAVIFLAFLALNCVPVYAAIGDMSFFGGITEGTRLPKTTEILLSQAGAKSKTAEDTTMLYKEIVMLSGTATEVEGLLTIRRSGGVTEDEDIGTFEVTYTVAPSETTVAQAAINRKIVNTVNWRREGSQIIYDYTPRSWTETIVTPAGAYALDTRQSHYGVSIIEDITAGVSYYRGDVSMRAVYIGEGTEANAGLGTVLEIAGSFYGYDCAWSNTETHRLDCTVFSGDDWQMQYQVRPSVSVNKIMQYMQNEPAAISFRGNYKEVMQNQSGLEYDVFVTPSQFFDEPVNGKANIPNLNAFEQLIAPDLDFLRGHYAEEDISKLFAMQVLEDEPKYFQPSQAMTRGQFVTALVKALKLPVEQPEAAATTRSSRRKEAVITLVFPDVTPDRREYPYIMSAYKHGITLGRDNVTFFIDTPIPRQEAITLMIRAVGLTGLGLDPTPMTAFVDDFKIADWARREMSAANYLGLVDTDEDGRVNPTDALSKADGAVYLNRLIDYMRSDLARDYTDHIVNYAN
ncbi:MAG: S-layer homology domain-containing protein [Clostridiales bacterium]|jgi:hypothetical protein|nr:S-layer homology domain-containing protein [Clostridiales bacterium]